MNITINIELPDDLAAYVRDTGEIEWGAVNDKTDEEHVADFVGTLRLTREHFKIQGTAPLHGLYSKGLETVMAHTGTSPTAPLRSRILVCLWNTLHWNIKETAELNGEAKP